jgi:patatin-related protein
MMNSRIDSLKLLYYKTLTSLLPSPEIAAEPHGTFDPAPSRTGGPALRLDSCKLIGKEWREHMNPTEVDHEKRFAVVMYGGVSLAVYINGVAQELFRLVKATAPGSPKPVSGTEKVYFELGELLRTRFVVDILSGTSAGGINAIFLAKALANSSAMDGLEKLWLEEGDVGVLINDKRSAIESLKTGFSSPRSLLNSRRMYRKLLDALKGMDPDPRSGGSGAAGGRPAGMVPEIDLFVTATDLQGLPLPLSLSDKVVYEYRHRSVFNFKKSGGDESGRDDFTAGNNPFLAFAARCTSSFPFAFEPMRLDDADGGRIDPQWEKFYKEYLLDEAQVDAETKFRHPEIQPGADGRYDLFTRRAFADGGYLDNKPFSYAIGAIGTRRSDVPVDRKLLYIEPSPDQVRDELALLDAPNAIENVIKVFSLARYETIREDLQAVLERNRLIERVGRILEGTLDDIQSSSSKSQPDSVRDWMESDLKRMIEKEGIAYGGYLRLRVAKLTDDLAEIIVRQAGFEPGSDLFTAVREIVRAWRDRKYDYYADENDKLRNFNQFLKDFNLQFFVSRLRFTIRSIDQLFRRAGDMAVDRRAAEEAQAEWSRPPLVVDFFKLAGQAREFREALKRIRGELSLRLEKIEKLRRLLLEPGKDNPLTAAVAALGLSARGIVTELLGRRSEQEARRAAEGLLDRHAAAFEKIAEIVREVVRRADAHSDLCKHALRLGRLHSPQDPDAPAHVLRARLAQDLDQPISGPRSEIRLNTSDPDYQLPTRAPKATPDAAVWSAAFYFRRFPHYDIVAFPILSAYSVGEEIDPVEIIRISPEDAQSLSRAGGRKLGGSTLMHFGAFFDRTWRKNDILWGRLDGAERLITCLLAGTPHEDKREMLIARAHRAIFKEVFQKLKRPPAGSAKAGPDSREMLDLLAAALLGKEPKDRAAVNAKLSTAFQQNEVKEILESVLTDNLTVGRIRKLFRGHQIDRRIEPRALLQAVSRAVQVVGRMLDAMALELSAHGRGKRAAAWITRIGGILWGLVEVATPHSIGRLLFRHWIVLALLVGGVLFLFGPAVGGGAGVRNFGGRLLLITALVSGVWYLFQAILQRRFRLIGGVGKAIATMIVMVFLALAAVGALYFDVAFNSLVQWLHGVLAGAIA